jgi:hypothetical protein
MIPVVGLLPEVLRRARAKAWSWVALTHRDTEPGVLVDPDVGPPCHRTGASPTGQRAAVAGRHRIDGPAGPGTRHCNRTATALYHGSGLRTERGETPCEARA